MEKPDAVAALQKFKVSGYIQTQYQWGEKAASLKVGAGNENLEKSFNRIGIRRGRIKFQYDEGIVSGVFQLDITDKTLSDKQYVSFKDAYLSISRSLRHIKSIFEKNLCKRLMQFL